MKPNSSSIDPPDKTIEVARAEEKQAARLRLVCSGCQGVQTIEMVETGVSGASGQVTKYCGSCGSITFWTVINDPAEATAGQAGEVKSSGARAANRRKHGRIKSNATACIREHGVSDDVCTCEDISRGGLRLKTSKAYPKGKWIEVAAPYSKGGANIFVLARIVRVTKCGSLYELGIAYAKTGETKPARPDGYVGSIPFGLKKGSTL